MLNNKHMDQVSVLAKNIERLQIKPKFIVEVGARDCIETVSFAQLYPDAEIHTFECDPLIIDRCRKNVAPYRNITLHEKAVSDYVGDITFHTMPSAPGSSSVFLHKTVPQEACTVPCTTLKNEFLQEIDFLWMDTQGSELNILKATDLTKVKIIHTEIYFVAAYDEQPIYTDIKKFLNENGFDLFTFSSPGKNFADAIFVNRSIYSRKTPQLLTEVLHNVRGKITGKARQLKEKFLD